MLISHPFNAHWLLHPHLPLFLTSLYSHSYSSSNIVCITVRIIILNYKYELSHFLLTTLQQSDFTIKIKSKSLLPPQFIYTFFLSSPKDSFSLLLEREERSEREREREREREKHQCEKHWLLVFWKVAQMEIKPSTWVCSLSGNRTCDPLVHRTMLQTTEPYQPRPSVLFST